MNYTLKELLDIDKLRELLDSLDELNSMPTAVLDTEGTILTATAWQDICTKFHRINPETKKKCRESDCSIKVGLDGQTQQVIYRCPMGLVDAAMPIIVAGEHIGNVFTGQLFLEPPDEQRFVQQARQYGFDETEYLAAMRQVPFFPEEKLRKKLTFLHSLTQILAEQGLHSKQQAKAEAKLRRQNKELVASQKRLRESEERFKALHDASFGGVIIHDKGLILDCNQALSAITGYRHEELMGMDGLKLIAPDSLDIVLKNISSGYTEAYEVEGRRKDGSIYPLAIRGKNATYQGRTVRVIEFRDITTRKQAENALLASETKLRNILMNLPVAIAISNRQQVITFRNKRFIKLFGYTEKNVPSIEEWWQYAYPDTKTRQWAKSLWEKAIKNALKKDNYIHNQEFPIVCHDGETRVVEVSGILFGEEILTAFVDVTERKRSEEIIEKKLLALTQPLEGEKVSFADLFDLEDVQRLQDEFAQATGVASLITNTDGTPITQPSNFTRLCSQIIRPTEKGYINCCKSDAALGRYHPEGPIVQPCLSGGLWDAGTSITVGGQHIANWLIGQVRDQSQTEENMRQYARNIDVDEAQFIDAFYEVPAMSRQQFKRIAKALYTLANQLSNAAYQNIQQARFITERKNFEQQLQESEKNLRQLIEQSPIGLALCTMDGALVTVNSAFANIIGYSIEETLQLSYWDITPQRYTQQEQQQLEQLEKTGYYGPYEKEYRHKEGHLVPVRLSGMIVVRDGQQYIWSSVEDITALKKAEEEKLELAGQLRQSQKMEAIGTLAGGVAHDFNNILSAILGYTELTLRNPSCDDKSRKNLKHVLAAAERARELVKQILMFSRKGGKKREPVKLNSVILEAVELLRKTIPASVHIQTDVETETVTVLADSTQIHQVVMNLCTNAYHSLPEQGGRISIRLQPVEIDALTAAKYPNLRQGRYGKLTVSDNGSGIHPRILPRIFDPFFTTKRQGHGTGMGLAVIHGIVQNHDGAIGVESAPQKGTTFKVFLPLASSQSFATETQQDLPAVQQGSEHILLVDDEKMLVNLGKEALEEFGYRVTATTSADEALAQFQQTPDEFDLLITDQTMPEMSGDVLAKKVMLIRANLPVLICTGHSAVLNAEKAKAIGVKALLMKPLEFNQLNQEIRKIFD